MKKFTRLMLFSLASIFSIYSTAAPTILEVKTKNIQVNGKSSQVYTIEQSNGTWGYYGYKGESFDVIVKNDLNESTVIHWHGLLLPNNQDGVELTQKLIAPHSQYHYNFILKNSGTYWMHSHAGLQEQKLAEAPLIIYDNKKENTTNDIVLMLQDFSFKDPSTIMNELTHGNTSHTNSMEHSNHEMHTMDMSDHEMQMNKNDSNNSKHHMTMDLNDVKYDAYLVNYRNLHNPQINLVKPDSTVRLRFINGSAMTNYWINLGNLTGTLIAVDGSSVSPITANKFQIGMGNRLDILVKIPKKIGYFSILAQVEGTKFQTGIILKNNSKVKPNKINYLAKQSVPALNYDQEFRLTPLKTNHDIPTESINQNIKLVLAGDMKSYVWTINGQIWPSVTPIRIGMNNEVQADVINNTMMSHPIHLHGFKFKVTAIDGKKVNGAIHDTILVSPHSTVKVIFFVDSPGKWFFHCHSLYHMHRGMMAYVQTESNLLTR
ncbi:MAG: multicopper oxidase family protein [Neisseriaceae bacterium]